MKSNLRQWRRAADLTQYDLARRLQMGRDRLWRIENGYTDPTPKERVALARVLRVSEETLFPHLQSEVAP